MIHGVALKSTVGMFGEKVGTGLWREFILISMIPICLELRVLQFLIWIMDLLLQGNSFFFSLIIGLVVRSNNNLNLLELFLEMDI